MDKEEKGRKQVEKERKEKVKDEVGENMQATAEQKPIVLQAAIKKISSKIPVLGGPKGKIKLNPNDETHKDWFEDDGE